MNDQERISIIYGTTLRLRRGNIHFTAKDGTERAIHVGSFGDDFLDALEYGQQLQEAGRRDRRGRYNDDHELSHGILQRIREKEGRM